MLLGCVDLCHATVMSTEVYIMHAQKVLRL